MRSFRFGARWASTALAALLLASSLTCLTAACRTLCGGEAGAVAIAGGSTAAAAAAEANLPPCHRKAAAGNHGTAPVAPTGGCGVGSPCCAQWLNDHATLRMTDPDPLRTLLPAGGTAPVVLLASSGLAFASDPPDLGPLVTPDDIPLSAVPRAATGTRGPPRVALAA